MLFHLRRTIVFGLGVLAAAGCAARSTAPATVVLDARPSPSDLPSGIQRPIEPVVPAPSSDEVSRQLGAILGDSATVSMLSAVLEPEITSDLEILAYASHERVSQFVDLFAGEAKDRMERWLSNGSRYEGMIRSKLLAAGLPEDLFFLALVESGFDPDAYSSAAAVGMWQFMTATGKAEGLKIDWWVDERRDPYLATDAAVRHLVWLRRQFGSLFLAAAAYNGGSGNMSRGLSSQASALEGAEGEGIFFALAETNYLKAETRDYVPKIIAVALVAKSARRYNIAVDSLAPFVFDSVLVQPSVPLAAIAKASSASLQTITELNSHILRGVTHPKDAMYVRVPAGSAADFAARFAELTPSDLVAFTRTTSQKGETFAAVAKRVGLTSKRLAWYNPRDGKTTRTLATGTTILVPSAAVVSAAKDVPDPALANYGGSASRHTVKSGETLGGIAIRYRTTVAAIKRLNGLSSDVIRAGQSLRVR